MIKKLSPIFALTFVNVIGFTLLIPVLLSVTQKYTTSSQLAAILFGVLLSSYALFQFIGAPILGSLSDKYGRKPILLITQLGTLLSWVIFGIAYFLPEIYFGSIALPIIVISFSRIIDGITGGNISVAQAYISDIASAAQKTKAFGLTGAVFGLGFLIGPALGGISASTQISYLGTVLVAISISLVTLALLKWNLPESLPPSKRDTELELKFWNEINILKKISQLKAGRFLNQLLLVRFFYFFVFSSFTTMIILYLEQEFELGQTSLGLFLSVIGLFSILNQAVVSPWVANKLGNLKTFGSSIIILIILLVSIPFIPTHLAWFGLPISLMFFLVHTFFLNLGISLGMPTFKSYLANALPATKQGIATGIDESLVALANSFMPILAGWAYATFGSASFAVFSGLMLFPFVWFWLTTGLALPSSPKNNSTS